MKRYPVPNDPAGRSFDCVLVRGDHIYAAEWTQFVVAGDEAVEMVMPSTDEVVEMAMPLADEVVEMAMPLTDQDGEYIELSPAILAKMFVTPVEAAELSDWAESTWRNQCAAGNVPGAVKRGKQWLIPRSEVKEKEK